VSRLVSPFGKEQVIGSLFAARTDSNVAPASDARGNQFDATSFPLFTLANSSNVAFVDEINPKTVHFVNWSFVLLGFCAILWANVGELKPPSHRLPSKVLLTAGAGSQIAAKASSAKDNGRTRQSRQRRSGHVQISCMGRQATAAVQAMARCSVFLSGRNRQSFLPEQMLF